MFSFSCLNVMAVHAFHNIIFLFVYFMGKKWSNWIIFLCIKPSGQRSMFSILLMHNTPFVALFVQLQHL